MLMRRSPLTLFVFLALTGCGAGWRQEPATPATTVPPRKQVQIFRGGEMDRWHAVSFTADSVVGIPWLQPIECDSCRRALPLAGVDSIQVGDPSLAFRNSMGVFYVGTLLASWWLCSMICGE